MEIRSSTKLDKSEIRQVHLQAFGEEGPEIVKLVNDLFGDKTTLPLLSLVAVEDNRIIGHILYTKAIILQSVEPVSAQLLAPLAVLHDAKKRGVGTQLIKESLKQLKESGVELVLVLGHPDYYP